MLRSQLLPITLLAGMGDWVWAILDRLVERMGVHFGGAQELPYQTVSLEKITISDLLNALTVGLGGVH